MIKDFRYLVRQYSLGLSFVVFVTASFSAMAQGISGLKHWEIKQSIPKSISYNDSFLPPIWFDSQPNILDANNRRQSLFKKEKPLNFYSLAIPAVGITYGVIALHKSTLQSLNFSIKNEIVEDHPHFLTHADNYLQFSPVAAVIGLNLFGVRGEHDFGDELCVYGISSLIMFGSVHIIKPIAHEERPDHSGFSSFPSGHTATAFAAAEWLRAEYWHRSPWIGIAGYAAATATGALRVYNNRHWVSDVIAGAAIGFLSTRIAYAVNPWIEKHIIHKKDKQKKPISYTWLEVHSARSAIPKAIRINNKIPQSQ